MASRLAMEGRHPHRQPRCQNFGSRLSLETPDCNLVCLDLKDGKGDGESRCDLDLFDFGSMAPIT